MPATKTPPRPLTGPQEKFAQLVAGGMMQSPAYKEAYGCKENSARAKAPLLLAKDSIGLRIAELRAENREIAKNTLASKFKALFECVEAEVSGPPGWADKLRALDIDNKMQGHYEPDKQEFTFNIVIGGNADE